ncbi:MAG TPA: sigma-70 family RNA polymerase sigma factor [Myxococcaceae bacterium]|jgi:RNA polymerase sigma-70 factor (ECF subfamily)
MKSEESAPRFEDFISAYRSMLDRRAAYLCRGGLDASEVVQNTMIQAARKYGQLRDHRSARAWLLRILFHAFIEALRAVRTWEPLDQAAEVPMLAETAPSYDRITREQLEAAIERLPDELRGTYRRFALEGRDYNFIAAELKITRSTVGTRILRARKRLREMLRPLVGEEGP